LSIAGQIVQPIARSFHCLMLHRPSIPRGAIIVRLHQDPEERVIVQPRGFLFAERSKFRPPSFAGVSGEIRKRLFQQASL
jgi:hypothetical protein